MTDSRRTLLHILGVFVTLAAVAATPSDAETPEPAGHWSLEPIRVVAPPSSSSWAWTPVDAFIERRLQQASLQPVKDADLNVLARRIYFNLTGLPPTFEQVERFLASARSNRRRAITQLVDELLASPEYGEKWSRHWLDLARYAESNGKDRDVVFPTAWRYRDYVIDAFNSDKQYDVFVREQIAGDLQPNAGDQQRIATTFLALGPKAFQETNFEKFSLDVVDEQIDVLSRSILGLTIACSRCHDHKYDPISTKDYYSLAGVLLSSDLRYGPGPLYVNKHEKDTKLIPIGERVKELHPIVARWRSEILETTETVTRLRSQAYRIQRDISGALRERKLKSADDDPGLAERQKEMLAMRAKADQLNKKRLEMIRTPPPEQPGYTMAVLEPSNERPPEDCAVRLGGMPQQRGACVPRGSLAIPGMPSWQDVAAKESGREQLAEWLASPRNPLTARVIVNRVWRHLFGEGLVQTVDNFGVMGDSPSHPELLDHLAAEFMADEWSVKRLVRRIMTSRVWQLASESSGHGGAQTKDPNNRLLWRANYRRLDVEAFRDAVLMVSDSLNRQPQRGSLFQDVYAGADYGEPNDHRVNFDHELETYQHRTVYLPLPRNRMPAFFRLFDGADPTTVTGARDARTIPAQALYLMNSPFMIRQSEAAARRMLAIPKQRRIDAAWQIATGRKPTTALKTHIETWLQRKASLNNDAGAGAGDIAEGARRLELERWTELMQSLFASAAFRYLE